MPEINTGHGFRGDTEPDFFLSPTSRTFSPTRVYYKFDPDDNPELVGPQGLSLPVGSWQPSLIPESTLSTGVEPEPPWIPDDGFYVHEMPFSTNIRPNQNWGSSLVLDVDPGLMGNAPIRPSESANGPTNHANANSDSSQTFESMFQQLDTADSAALAILSQEFVIASTPSSSQTSWQSAIGAPPGTLPGFDFADGLTGACNPHIDPSGVSLFDVPSGSSPPDLSSSQSSPETLSSIQDQVGPDSLETSIPCARHGPPPRANVVILDRIPLHPCPHCSEEFATLRQLTNHESTHLLCGIDGCAKAYKHDKSLRRHRDNKHYGKRLQCDLCSHVDSRADNLRRHQQNRH